MKWKSGAKNIRDKCDGGDSYTAGDGCGLAEPRYIAELILCIFCASQSRYCSRDMYCRWSAAAACSSCLQCWVGLPDGEGCDATAADSNYGARYIILFLIVGLPGFVVADIRGDFLNQYGLLLFGEGVEFREGVNEVGVFVGAPGLFVFAAVNLRGNWLEEGKDLDRGWYCDWCGRTKVGDQVGKEEGKMSGRGMEAYGRGGVSDRGNQNVFWKPGKVPASSWYVLLPSKSF